MEKSIRPDALRYRLLAVLFLAVIACRAEDDLANQPAPRAVPVEDLLPNFDGTETVISRSEQFRISGGDAATRGTAANLAEETKDELLRLSEEKDEWKVPIRISLRGKRGDPVPKRETVLLAPTFDENGYKLELMVNLSRDLRNEPFKRAVTEALIYAKHLQNQPTTESDVLLAVPPWVVEGLREASAWRLKHTDRKLYEALFRSGGLFQLDDLFALSEAEYISIDAASRAAFRISAGALMMALIEQPDGKAGVRNFLVELAGFQGEMPALLRKHFPDLNLSEKSLEKWWALQLANKGTAPLTESLGVIETDRGLDEALRLRHKDEAGVLKEIPLAQWESLAELEEVERIEAVRLAEDDLLRLSYRSFPSYRMLLLEYQSLLSDFAKGNTKSMAESLQALSETRATMVAKAERARDFMDWFEITRARETSGAFDDYLSLKARLKNRPTTRTDSLSKYLDRLDPLFTVPGEKKAEPFDFIPPPF
ncbi:MAG: hypothetical protein RLZZ505_1421 [Verrucomicrobiota bacterium]|jgi:hypothetical protein